MLAHHLLHCRCWKSHFPLLCCCCWCFVPQHVAKRIGAAGGKEAVMAEIEKGKSVNPPLSVTSVHVHSSFPPSVRVFHLLSAALSTRAKSWNMQVPLLPSYRPCLLGTLVIICREACPASTEAPCIQRSPNVEPDLRYRSPVARKNFRNGFFVRDSGGTIVKHPTLLSLQLLQPVLGEKS